MIRRPPSSTCTDPLFPSPPLFRSIEPALVRDAALHATEEDFQALEASIERLAKIGNDAIAFANENREFHSIIARASANPVLETFWRSEEHTSELQSLMRISYAVFCLKKKRNRHFDRTNIRQQ